MRFSDRCVSIASTGLDLVGIPGLAPAPKLIERLRSFDSIVSWYGANRPDFRFALAELGLSVQFFDALPPPTGNVHCADFFARQVGAPIPAMPRIAVPELRPETAIVIHPFSGSARKNWPLERFRELAAVLPLPVRWCAGPEEPLDGAIRIGGLYELAQWIGRAQLYIGNDSGVTHLAAAAGVPVVAIFGPTNPAIWAPRGERVRVVQGQLNSIGVENVLDAIQRLL